jgi:hypothetical protein
LRDALGELARISSRAAKLQPESLSRALIEARRQPLKRAMMAATKAERYPPATRAQVVERPPPPAPSSQKPPLVPHVQGLISALQRTIKVYIGEYPAMTQAELLNALNQVYIAVQEGDLLADWDSSR